MKIVMTLYAVNISNQTHEIFKDFNDTILIIDPGQKKISSTEGHKLMNKNPFSNQRYDIARKNVIDLKNILKSGDLDGFISIAESEALMIHSLMLTSNPSYILMKPNTLKVISKITEYRSESKLSICFTLDAGSNVHLLYPNNIKDKISDFINNELIQYCSSNKYIEDKVGSGPEKDKLMERKIFIQKFYYLVNMELSQILMHYRFHSKNFMVFLISLQN